MSKDSSIYFWTEKFPYEEWEKVMHIFTGNYKEQKTNYAIALKKMDVDHGSAYCDEWVMYEENMEETGNVWISLHAFTPNYLWTSEKPRPRWEIGLHWGTATEIDLASLLPLAALFWFDNICFYERQWDERYFDANSYLMDMKLPGDVKNLDSFKIYLIEKGKQEIKNA